MSKQVFVVAAKRTAFGSFGGSLKGHSATVLQAEAAKAALAAGKVDPSIVDATIVGNVAQTSIDAAYIARHAALQAGIPIESPSLTINRLCGSGFQSVINAVQEIQLGRANVVLTGGSENMSQAPFSSYEARWGLGFGRDAALKDTLSSALVDSHIKTPMAITAENLAEKYNITREQVDAYALQSQQRWAAADEAGVFDAEIGAIDIKTRKGVVSFAKDEHARPQTKIEGLAKLKPVFKKDGVVTAGNASGISDGAGAVILASEDAVKTHNLTPLARIVDYEVSGVDPSIMGIGPVPAIKGALKRAGLTLDDMSRVEINEAFAAQYLACEQELGLNRDITNINGGAIALGHPLGASGSRITAHLVHDLHRVKGKYAVGSACIGGGQGIAVVLERA